MGYKFVCGLTQVSDLLSAVWSGLSQNVSIIMICIWNAVCHGKYTCISFWIWHLVTTFILILATVILLKRVNGVFNRCHLFQISLFNKHLYAAQKSVFFAINTSKGLIGVKSHLKVLSIKAMQGRIPGDFLKPLLISRIDPDSRIIHSMAMENTLMSTQN